MLCEQHKRSQGRSKELITGEDRKKMTMISPSGRDCKLRPSPLQWGGIKGSGGRN